MNNGELVELEQGIRAALEDHGLGWVLEDIDEGIKAKSRIEVVAPKGRQGEEAALFERPYALPPPGYKGKTMVGEVPVEPVDRVEVMVTALYRLIVELPAIHEDAVNRLANTDDDDHDSMVEDMVFLPDEDDNSPEVPSVTRLMASAGLRSEAAGFLARLRDEVMR